MSQPLPIGEFEWICDEIVAAMNVDIIMNIPDDSENGFIFEVDLIYPESIHHEHNLFPFCAERCTLTKEAFDILNKKPNKMEKLMLILYDKEKYAIHYRMLKLALRHGLVLKKVHRILKFKQSQWLKPYIDLNTELRTKATNDFEKTLFKLLNNSAFGKTMENLRLRQGIKLVNKWGGRCGARMMIASPNFKRLRIFDENLIAVERRKTHILMNKPISVGMSVLDVSKVVMYEYMTR